MAGLSVLLETTTTTAAKQHQLQLAGSASTRTTQPQIISKAAILNATSARTVPSSQASTTTSPMAAVPMMTCSSFLQRCFLCHMELADGVDIYIYRGDRAFCSEECRCRHILVEDDDGAIDCARVAAAGRSRRRRQAAGAGGFAF